MIINLAAITNITPTNQSLSPTPLPVHTNKPVKERKFPFIIFISEIALPFSAMGCIHPNKLKMKYKFTFSK